MTRRVPEARALVTIKSSTKLPPTKLLRRPREQRSSAGGLSLSGRPGLCSGPEVVERDEDEKDGGDVVAASARLRRFPQRPGQTPHFWKRASVQAQRRQTRTSVRASGFTFFSGGG